jgi:hypothetical protein
MASNRFDQWTRGIDLPSSRYGLRGLVAGTLVARWELPDAEARKKKRKKKGMSYGCSAPYFDCNGECRLSGACCDGKAGYDCAEGHASEPGRWVCCSTAGFGCFNLDSDRLNCNACGHACTGSDVCCHGVCGPAPCLP